MLTPKEEAFIAYWQKNRTKQNTTFNKLLGGLPMAIIFVLPIILLVLGIWLFVPEWYTKISKTSPAMFLTALFALFCVVLFYSFFRMQYKWEMNEQLYQELLYKQSKNS
jgi:predicted membrane channel-forming protein YqfA (hemolysin III family)